MKNYICLNGVKTELTAEQVAEMTKGLGIEQNVLKDVPVGGTFSIGEHEFIVLEQLSGQTAVILKGLLYDNEAFGSNNNYNGSHADELCNDIAEKMENMIGTENIYEHKVDLTAANGMKCYGAVNRKVSLLTLERVRQYADILAENPIDEWWWLATPSGTAKWGNQACISCVSPSGCIRNNFCYDCNYGVRPFCILNSNIFVSK